MERPTRAKIPRDALVRELREELGIEVTVRDILDVAFHRYEDAERAVLLLVYPGEHESGFTAAARSRRGGLQVE